MQMRGNLQDTKDTKTSSLLASSSAYFEPESGNMQALKKSNLQLYCNAIPDVSTMLPALQEQGLLTDKTAVSYTMQDFLDEHPYPKTGLNQSSFNLLSQPLPDTFNDLPETPALPAEFKDLAREMDFYTEMIIDVLNNELSQKPYEKVKDRENVTEREHGDQAGKISMLLGMPLADVLALLLHDIARPSVNDADYGHIYHGEQGRQILQPQGVTDYSGTHAFAKYLLFHYCPPYKELISSVSKDSLAIQTDILKAQTAGLQQLDGKPLAEAIYTIMFMRLIDDMSKAPEWKLMKMRGGVKTDYADNEMIMKMMRTQMMSHVQNLAENSKDTQQTVADFKLQLDTALVLLLRAQKYSNNPSLYEKYSNIIDTLPKLSSNQAMRCG